MDNKPPVSVEAAGANGIGEADSMQRPGYAAQPWSAEKPKAAGRWRWRARECDTDEIALTVFESADGLRVDTHGILHTQPLLAFLGGWWAAPLSESWSASDAETRHTSEIRCAERARRNRRNYEEKEDLG